MMKSWIIFNETLSQYVLCQKWEEKNWAWMPVQAVGKPTDCIILAHSCFKGSVAPPVLLFSLLQRFYSGESSKSCGIMLSLCGPFSLLFSSLNSNKKSSPAHALADFECFNTLQWLHPSFSEIQWHGDVMLLLVCELGLRSGFLLRPCTRPAFVPSPNTRDTNSSLSMLLLLDSAPVTTLTQDYGVSRLCYALGALIANHSVDNKGEQDCI